MPRLSKEDKRVLQRRKMLEVWLELDEIFKGLAKKHKLTLRDMYDLTQEFATMYLKNLLLKVKR